MQTEKYILNDKRNVTLTSYILDPSDEMPLFKRRPAMLVIPGGAYAMCSDREAEPVAMAYLAEGYNAFVLRYSVKEHSTIPNPLDDACEAMSFIRENADKFNIFPDKVAAIGFSAGGHLTAMLSNAEGFRPDAAILGYPCILESMAPVLYNKPMFNVNESVTKDTPPTFIVSTYGDNCVPVVNSIKYAEALANNGVPFEMHIFERGNHGLSVANPQVCSNRQDDISRIMSQWVPMSVTWLNNRFGIGKGDWE